MFKRKPRSKREHVFNLTDEIPLRLMGVPNNKERGDRGMKWWEALEVATQGKKVRGENFIPGVFVECAPMGFYKWNTGEEFIMARQYINQNWEIYKEEPQKPSEIVNAGINNDIKFTIIGIILDEQAEEIKRLKEKFDNTHILFKGGK